MTLYQNKYRVESARHPHWDYTSNGYYFVTICTHNRQHFFGRVIAGKMQLSDIGKIVADEWQKTSQIRSNVKLDEWVVMPNHFHGIIIIDNPAQTFQNPAETFRRNVSNVNSQFNQSTNKSRLKPDSLGSIIGQFKSVCTKQIRQQHPEFRWQTRFHDIIIRNEKSLHNIRRYIINNPAKWSADCFHPQSGK